MSKSSSDNQRLLRAGRSRLLFAALTAVAGIGCWFFWNTESAFPEAEVHTVRSGNFRWWEESIGTVEPISTTLVQSDCLWTVEILSLLPEGTQVEKGDVVCVLDSSEIEEFLRTREVSLVNAQARLTKSENDLELQQLRSDRKLATADFSLNQAEMNLAEYLEGTWPNQIRNLNRDIALSLEQSQSAGDEREFIYRMWMQGMATNGQLQQSKLKQTTQDEKLRTLQGRKTLLENYTHPTQRRTLEYRVSNLQFNLDRTQLSNSLSETRSRMQTLTDQRRVDIYERYARIARESIDACTIRAPVSGQVLYANSWYDRSRDRNRIEVGRSVYQTQPIFQIPNDSKLTVRFPIHETLISRIAVGLQVDVLIAGYEETPVSGTVREISAYPRSRSVNGSSIREFVLEAVLNLTDEQNEWVHAQMEARVEVPLQSISNAVVIPRSAILRDGTTPSVLLFRDDDREPLRVAVKPGEVSHGEVHIVDGLKTGDRIISDASAWIRARADQ